MFEASTFIVFLTAALTLAIIPGPGMLYVLTRTLRGGRREGMLSTAGTGLAGMLHTFAAALGLSAILATSAVAFGIVKWLGVAYLIYLGVKTLLQRATFAPAEIATPPAGGALRQGFIAEILNPKTALFFLAFIPQFVDPASNAFWQFVALGAITTLLTSGVDLIVVLCASPLSSLLQRSRRLQLAQRYGTGAALVGLGVYVAVDR
ncbi:MAG: LysE family translocator [Trueperaceae bacterium]|nr:LysE family translocator [Trueperaceae bacterium]